ncbi:MAG: hypothetical protein LBL49_05180 [Clostridiales Family XIII bacterium]|jgi:hypothetical protein|nr:hypothetical protein [Clostridiales Family XIII bacterium]
MLKIKVLKAFLVLTLVFTMVAAFTQAGAGTVHAAANTVLDVKGGLYIPVLIHNGMTDVASVGAYAQAKGAYAAINGTYFDAYATEAQVTAKGGDVNVLRTFSSLYGAPLNFPSGVLIDNGRLIHGAGFGSGPGQWGGYDFKDVYFAVGSYTAKINGVGGSHGCAMERVRAASTGSVQRQENKRRG